MLEPVCRAAARAARARGLKGLLAGALLAGGAPLAADVREGVEAWSRGEYAAAVAHWQPAAKAGDPDALFNLGQAHRLGRGVAQDPALAESLYLRAARLGHLQAADTYGLMLFQDGRREEALAYVEAAARRGDPRARYLLGLAHFNGDLLGQDWERAYALVMLANSAGLPQAARAIAQMDEYIPLEQRQSGAALARILEEEAQAARMAELTQAEIGGPPPSAPASPAPTASALVPRPIAPARVAPSAQAGREALARALEATGLESPQGAGASFAGGNAADRGGAGAGSAVRRPAASPPPAAVVAASVPARPALPSSGPSSSGAGASPAAAAGPWRVQLGAFAVRGNAEALWQRLSSRAELAGASRLLVPAGKVTRLLAGGFASRSAAQAACAGLKRAGLDCLVIRD